MFSTHDPANTIVTLGPLLFTGFADGSMIQIERDEDTYSKKVGAQGDTTRVRSRNRNGRATVRLQAQSPTNALLSARMALGESSNLDVGVFQAKDLSTNTTFTAVAGWLVRPAGADFAQDATEREWMIDLYQLVVIHGTPSLIL